MISIRTEPFVGLRILGIVALDSISSLLYTVHLSKRLLRLFVLTRQNRKGRSCGRIT